MATTDSIIGKDVQELMVATVEHRYEQVNRVPDPIEWLNDNGSCSPLATDAPSSWAFD